MAALRLLGAVTVLVTLLAPHEGVTARQDPTRALRSVPAPVGPAGRTQDLYTSSYALLIGVSRQDHPGAWVPLDSVWQELGDLKTALLALGFNDVEQIVDPTGEELRRGVQHFITRYGYNDGARLLFYFAGHGFTLDQGRRGYFVPRDAPDPLKDERKFRATALSMDQVATWARDITARHALFAFDSCFSGTIFRTRDRPVPEPISELTAKKVRLFMSAGGAGEPVPARSVFTPMFSRALRGAADLNRDGFITGTELGNWVQAQVIEYRTRQTPQFGKLRDPDYDEGDMVFAVPASAPPRPAPLTLPPPLADRLTKCNSGVAAECTNLGYAFGKGQGIAVDFARAAQFYQRGCDAGNAAGCRLLGWAYAQGEGVPQDRTRSAELYRRACDSGDAIGCNNLGVQYADGVGVVKDGARAIELYRRACDAKNEFGCRNLAIRYEKGDGVPRDLARALTLYRTACDLKHEGACEAVKRLAAAAPTAPSPPAPSPALPPALAEMQTKCTNGIADECTRLGFAFATGQGIAPDFVRAAQWYQRGCDSGSAIGCRNLGWAYRLGRGVAKDLAHGFTLYNRACEGGDPGGCDNVGVAYRDGIGVPGTDQSRAVRYFQRACDGGSGDGCNNLGALYAEGKAVPRDVVRAVDLYTRACNAKNAFGCRNLAVKYETGDGVARDAARALTLYRTACELKDQTGCDAVKRIAGK